MRSKQNIFEVGDLIFAKIRFFPPWPAKLTKVVRPNQVEVVFFGDFNKATVAADKLVPYCEKTKIQYDIESSRRRPKFKEAMIQIAEAHRETPEEIASQMLVENIGSDDESTQQNLQEIGSANAVVTVDDFDGFLIGERSKRDNLKKAMASNPTPAKKAILISYELMLTTIDLKFAASIDDPDPDLALHLLERLLSEILPETTTSQLFRNPDVVEVLAALTNYIGSVELSEFDEALSRLLEARFTEIRAVAGSALEKVKDLFPSLPRDSSEVWTSFAFHAAHIIAAMNADDRSQVPSSLTQF